MSRIVWDSLEDRLYELGVSKGVLYRPNTDGEYKNSTAWNGLINVSENPSGADNNKLYADNIEYAAMRAAETFGGSIEAYTYPPEFAECDGSAEIVPGVYAGQQIRKPFGFCYRTEIGSAAKGQETGYKLHLLYGLTASPSEKAHDTINDSPDAATMSWDVEATPVAVKGFRPTACLTISSLDHSAEKMKALEDILYGVDEVKGSNGEVETQATVGRLPLPDEIAELMKVAENKD